MKKGIGLIPLICVIGLLLGCTISASNHVFKGNQYGKG
jgi:hypothetical protein